MAAPAAAPTAGAAGAAGEAGAPVPAGVAARAATVTTVPLVIIFFLDSFNATVYSVGGQDIQDATDQAEARRRADEIDQGKVQMVSGEELERQVQELFK